MRIFILLIPGVRCSGHEKILLAQILFLRLISILEKSKYQMDQNK